MIKKKTTISKQKASELWKIMIGDESPKIFWIKASQDSSSFTSEDSGYHSSFDKFWHFFFDIWSIKTFRTKIWDKTMSDGNISNKSDWSSEDEQ